jgi:hypothetical protein
MADEVRGISKDDRIDVGGKHKISRPSGMKSGDRKRKEGKPSWMAGLALSRGTLWKVYFPAAEIKTRSVVSGP